MPHVYLYAKYQFVGVTNLHNVCRDAACVIRANCKVCEPDAIAIEPDQWAFIPVAQTLGSHRPFALTRAATICPSPQSRRSLQRKKKHRRKSMWLTMFL